MFIYWYTNKLNLCLGGILSALLSIQLSIDNRDDHGDGGDSIRTWQKKTWC
jgi:hypothetical protein